MGADNAAAAKRRSSGFLIGVLMASTALTTSLGLATDVAAQDAASAPATVQQKEQAFSIEAQPLQDALVEFGDQSTFQVTASADLVRERQSPGVYGVMTPLQALTTLLTGTGITFSMLDATTVVLQGPGETTSEAMKLGTVNVSGRATGAYQPRASSTATKTTLPPSKTPFTVNQVTTELALERGDDTIYETLEKFAGVTTASSNGDIGQSMSRTVNVRGFQVSGTNQLLINGQRTYGSAGDARSPFSLEAIEVLRGPAALYYGAAEPGGVVNYSYKKPLSEERYTVLLGTDTKASFDGMVDMTGPLTDDNTLLYRVVGGFERYNDDQNHIWQQPASVLGALTFAPTPDFETTLTYEWLDMKSVPEQENNFLIGTGPMAGEFYPVPRDFFWGSLNDRAETKTHTVLLESLWEVSPYVTLKANGTYQHYDMWWQNTRLQSTRGVGRPSPDANGNVPRYVSGRQGAGDSWSVGADATGDFSLYGFEHEWLIGGGRGYERTRSSGRQVASQSREGGPYPVGELNIFNPDYRDYPYQYRIWDDPLGDPNKRNDTNFYVQDMITLPWQTTRVMLAGGWSRYKDILPDESNTSAHWSPRIALMQDFNDDLMFYASFGQSFVPNSLGLLNAEGDYITTPQKGTQYEVGLKQELFNDRLLATLAVFRINKRNIPMALQDASLGECDPGAAPAPGTPATYDGTGDCRYMLNGLERSQGVEVNIAGAITEWWNAQISYAYLDTEVVESDDPYALGRSLSYMPKQNVSLWNKFRLVETQNMGVLSLGLGLTAWSKSHGTWGPADADGDMTSWNPGYALVDLGLFLEDVQWQGQNLKFSANVHNLFDRTYYDRRRYADSGTIVWGNERRISFSVRSTF